MASAYPPVQGIENKCGHLIMIQIYQIYYNDETRAQCEDGFLPFYNQVKDEFFENTVIRHVHEMFKPESKYYGVVSPKFKEKAHMTGRDLMARVNADVEQKKEKDVYIFCPAQVTHPKWDLSAPEPRLHGTIRDINIWHAHKLKSHAYKIDAALNDSGVLPFKLFTERSDGSLEVKWIYSWNNFWIAKRHVFEDYCNNVLIPAMDWMAKQDFPKSYLHPGSQRYVTHICFTLEGTFGAFLANRNYSFDYICKRKFRGKYEWLHIDGYEDNFINKKKDYDFSSQH